MNNSIDKWELFDIHQQVILSCIKEIDDTNYQTIMSKIFRILKKNADLYWNFNSMDITYNYLLNYVLMTEDRRGLKKIIDVSIDVDDYNKDNFLDLLVYKTRKYLLDQCCSNNSQDKNINNINLANKCKTASFYVDEFCKHFSVYNYQLQIYPGYDENVPLFDGNGYHFANIINKDGEYYLVDVTYSQFFYDYRNNLDRLGIFALSPCSVGTYVMLDLKRKMLALELLKNGYVKLDSDKFKTYLDSFTISFRNGLYYESTNDFSYTTDYSTDDYINFLKGNDSQILHEGRENLGYQMRLLKNYNLDFRQKIK